MPRLTKITSFDEINSLFDTYFLDMYGVLWDGTDFYPNVLKTLEKLKKHHRKKICILSNMTSPGSVFCALKAEKGLIRGVHFDEVITSGDLCRTELQQGLFQMLSQKENYRFFVLGEENKALFDAVAAHETPTLETADVIYLSGLGNKNPDDFFPALDEALYKNIPAVCANPDTFFMQNNQKRPAQGLLADYYRQKGGKVVFFGKPYPLIYQTALTKLGARPAGTLMIGDTPQTDIQGALNAGLHAMLLTRTGIVSHLLQNGETLDNILNHAKIYPNFIKETFADD